ncbi:MAG: NAD(P)H-binding protein, partial [Acidobacteriota bacterium]
MKLLILGAAGGTGRQLVQQAIGQGHSVTAWTHHTPQPPFPPSVELITADIHDPARLAATIASQDAVIDTLG